MNQQQIEPPARILIPDSAYRRPVGASLPKRIRDMYTLFGSTAGHTCMQCQHLSHNHPSRTKRYYKCQWQRCTAGPATDWHTRWPACGKFEDKT